MKKTYTDIEYNRIIEFTKNNGPYYWLFYLLITTGMRFGEAVALTWDDVDFDNKTININKISVEISGSPTIQEKTKTGGRIITISDSLESFLKEVKAEQNKELNVQNLVLPNTHYGIYTSANCRRRWMDVCEKLEIPYNGIHALRHSWAIKNLGTIKIDEFVR